MSHLGHERVEYACGHVKSQCRCMDPGKTVTKLGQPCPSCAAKGLPYPFPVQSRTQVADAAKVGRAAADEVARRWWSGEREKCADADRERELKGRKDEAFAAAVLEHVKVVRPDPWAVHLVKNDLWTACGDFQIEDGPSNRPDVAREIALTTCARCLRAAYVKVFDALVDQRNNEEVNIVFDGPPGPEGGHFVEVERLDGTSVSVGEWVETARGFWNLRLRVVR